MSTFGHVLISSHLSHDMLGIEDSSIPLYGAQIEDHFGPLIDLIIDPGEVEFLGSTTIVDFTTGEPLVVRQGICKSDLFKR